MKMTLKLKITPFSDHRMLSTNRSFVPAHVFSPASFTTVKCSSPSLEDSIAKIKEKINGKVEVSPSAYDTAWVAMVPSRDEPCFPECLEWIMNNQNSDGSWGLQQSPSNLLIKDSLSCTLASLLALRKWNLAHQLVNKGLEFIKENAWAATDAAQQTPIGFNIVFPMMINHANHLGLTLPLNQDLLNSMFRNRDTEIERNQNLEYVAEGLGGSLDWDKLLRKQRKNGSLFNSPATTAAALIHSQNRMCSDYLHSVLKRFKTWVPTIYPFDIYGRLSMIDTLHRLGVDQYFQYEIDNILQETYTLWQKRDEEIFADATTCAITFRLLRIKGYQVSSDELAPYGEQEMRGVSGALELYRASQIRVDEEETTLEKLHTYTTTFLKHQLLSNSILDEKLQKQVEYDLHNFHGIVDRLGNRRSIELYHPQHYDILKAAYRCPTIHSEDLYLFSRQIFNICQAQQQEELQQLMRWYTGLRLDSLKHARNALHFCHFLASAIFGDPQHSDARICFAKVTVLVQHMDDLFDLYGSTEEVTQILELVKMWKEQSGATSYVSEEVEILYTALYSTVNEYAAKAYIVQGRCVKRLLISLWVELFSKFMIEMDWRANKTVPNMDEYLCVAWKSTGCRTGILTSIHLIGIKLSEDDVLGPEYTSMCRHVCLVLRLINDLRASKREEVEKKTVNSVRLLLAAHSGAITEDEAISRVVKMAESNKRKLLQLILKTEETIVPKECKDIFWKICQFTYYMYSQADEFSSPQQTIQDMKSMIHEPLHLHLH